jgi:hypothetical protein
VRLPRRSPPSSPAGRRARRNRGIGDKRRDAGFRGSASPRRYRPRPAAPSARHSVPNRGLRAGSIAPCRRRAALRVRRYRTGAGAGPRDARTHRPSFRRATSRAAGPVARSDLPPRAHARRRSRRPAGTRRPDRRRRRNSVRRHRVCPGRTRPNAARCHRKHAPRQNVRRIHLPTPRARIANRFRRGVSCRRAWCRRHRSPPHRARSGAWIRRCGSGAASRAIRNAIRATAPAVAWACGTRTHRRASVV